MQEKPFLDFYGITEFEDANNEKCELSEMSNIIAITHYLSEVLYAKDISTLPSVFKSDHIFYTKIIEFFNQEDSLSEFVNELLNSCIYHITNEKLLEHFPNGASGTVSTNRNHENCISCIAGTGFILNYSLISGAADPLNSSKAGYQIIYHGSFKDSWLIWLSSCGTLRNSREGVFNLNDSSAFYCSYIFKTALDFAFKYNKSNPGVVISFWLDEKIYSDPLYVYLKTRIGIDGTSEWGEAVKSFRKNDENC